MTTTRNVRLPRSLVEDTIDSDHLIIQSDVALLETAQAEPTGVPAANEAPLDKLGYLFLALRNKKTADADWLSISGDDLAVEWKHALADDGTTYTEGEAEAP